MLLEISLYQFPISRLEKEAVGERSRDFIEPRSEMGFVRTTNRRRLVSLCSGKARDRGAITERGAIAQNVRAKVIGLARVTPLAGPLSPFLPSL